MAGKEYEIAIKIMGALDSSLNSAVAGASSKLESLGKVGSAIADSAKVAAQAYSALAKGIGSVGKYSMGIGQDFEAAMSSVAATAGASAEDYKKLEAAAMEMGRSTSKTASESANALEYMALAGWSVDQSIQGLPSILRLSEATGMDLAQCSDLVTDSMSALGVTVDDLSGYLDIAAKANNKSNQTAEHLMEAYLAVGGTMHGLGVPIEESATALGVLANRGIKGSEAGTALNAVMINLTTGTGQAGKMMESLGISAFDSQGNFKGLKATLEEVNSALAGCTDEERNAALAAIGGKVHVDALNDLMAGLNTTNAEGVSEWDALNQELQNANGSLEEMANTKLDNLAGDMAIFESACQDAGIKIYKNIQDPLRDVYQFATDEIYKLSDALESGGFSGLASAFGGVMADAIPMLSGYGHDFINMVSLIADGLFSGIMDNAPQIGSTVAGLVTHLITSFLGFYEQFYSAGITLITEFLDGMVDNIPIIISTLGGVISGLAGVFLENADSFGTSAGWIIIQLVNGIGEALPEVAQAALWIVQGLLRGILSAATVLIQAGPSTIQNFITGILGALPSLLTEAGNILQEFLNGIIGALPLIVSGGAELLNGIIQGIVQTLPNIATTGVNVVLNLITAIVSALPMVIQSAASLLGALISGIAGNLGNIISAGIQIIVALAQGIINAIPVLLSSIPSIFGAFVQGIASVDWLQVGKDILTAIGNGIISAIGGLADIAGSAWSAIKGFFSGGGKDAGNESVKGIQDAGPQIQTAAMNNGIAAVSSMAEGVSGNLATLSAAGSSAGTSLTDAMNLGIQTGTAALDASVSALGTQTATSLNTSLTENLPAIDAAAVASGTAITDGITTGIDTGMMGAAETASGASIDTVNAMAEGISSGAETITATVQNLTETVQAALSQCWSDISAGASTAWTGIGDGMTQTLTAMGTATTTALTNIDNSFTSTLQSIQSKTDASFTAIVQSITTKMQQAQTALQSGISAMKSALNFTWKLPDLKVPHISVSGSFNLEPPTAPNFRVNWYAKGGVLDGAQIFGAAGGSLLGGGEAGKEAVLPLDTLWTEMRNVLGDVVANTPGGGVRALSDAVQANNATDNVGFLADSLGYAAGNAADRGTGGGNTGGDTYNVTFSPQIIIQGSADRETIDAALAEAQARFPAWFQQMVRSQKRREF